MDETPSDGPAFVREETISAATQPAFIVMQPTSERDFAKGLKVNMAMITAELVKLGLSPEHINRLAIVLHHPKAIQQGDELAVTVEGWYRRGNAFVHGDRWYEPVVNVVVYRRRRANHILWHELRHAVRHLRDGAESQRLYHRLRWPKWLRWMRDTQVKFERLLWLLDSEELRCERFAYSRRRLKPIIWTTD